ncbi:MAG: aminotransferase [Polaromonas sp.]|nr:aminotransferase [Polaromonas sp.]
MTRPAHAPDTTGRVHGGPDEWGVPAHDFSTNSNACGPCPQALAAVQQADAGSYPDPAYADLRERLAAFHGADPARIALAGSASELIFRITSLLAHRPGAPAAVWVPAHGYGDYGHAAHAYGLRLADDPAHAQLRWACDPSSPLGGAHGGLAGLAGAPSVITVLDRAYEPLRLEGALAVDDAQLQGLWQLWTPNKALGLTGVRAAYALAPEGADARETVLALDARSPSWPVGAHGVAMLEAWTRAPVQAWLAGSRVQLAHWKARQVALCAGLGWTCLPSLANFFCARPALPEGIGLADALHGLRRHGVKLRDTTSFGLPGQVRLGVLPPASQDALQHAWRDLVKKAAPMNPPHLRERGKA